jgi:hypothetical protein
VVTDNYLPLPSQQVVKRDKLQQGFVLPVQEGDRAMRAGRGQRPLGLVGRWRRRTVSHAAALSENLRTPLPFGPVCRASAEKVGRGCRKAGRVCHKSVSEREACFAGFPCAQLMQSVFVLSAKVWPSTKLKQNKSQPPSATPRPPRAGPPEAGCPRWAPARTGGERRRWWGGLARRRGVWGTLARAHGRRFFQRDV